VAAEQHEFFVLLGFPLSLLGFRAPYILVMRWMFWRSLGVRSMSTKHTPGPWHRNIKPASHYPTIFAGRCTHIAVVTAQRAEEQTEANCNLIKEAPALLELAEAFVAYLDDDSRSPRRRAECLASARSVIARAKGQA
jgi:hypothetical protein